MLSLCFLLILMQNEQAVEDNGTVRFSPIRPGNRLYHGPFTLVVPEGAWYVAEENAPFMYKLFHVEDIPNCVGVFTSANANWDYAVAVQYSDAPIVLSPQLPIEKWNELVLEKNLLDGRQMEVPGSILIPPSLNEQERSFTLGVEYLEENLGETVVLKKVWSHTDGGLVLSLFAKKPAYIGEEEVIDRIFSSVEVAPLSETIKGEVQSYITSMGVLQLSLQPKEPAAPVVEEDEPLINVRLLLFGMILALLVGVVVIFKRKPSSGEEPS